MESAMSVAVAAVIEASKRLLQPLAALHHDGAHWQRDTETTPPVPATLTRRLRRHSRLYIYRASLCHAAAAADCPNQLYTASVVIIIISIVGAGMSLSKAVKPVDLRASSMRMRSFRSGDRRAGAIEMR